MKNIFKYIIFTLIGISAISCESLVDDINDNPNNVTIEDVDAGLFLNGAMLANNQVQLGHIMRISSMWSGHLVGFQSLYKALYEYNITSAETDGIWQHAYFGVLAQCRHIRASLPDDDLYQGITKVLEANAIGTIAAIFGDVPYSEAANEDIDDPKFDSQVAVFAAMQTLLDQAIADLGAVPSKRVISTDIYFSGDHTKWIEAAWTLKARYYMLTREYGNAYNAALKGISSPGNSMKYKPPTTSSAPLGDKNLFYTMLTGSRAGDVGTGNSYLMQLLDPANENSRNHAKTDETARRAYLTIVESSGSANRGVAAALEPMPLVIYEENLLTLAEAGARTQGFAKGLEHLNALRTYLASGNAFRKLNEGDNLLYEAFVAADFDNGGIENPDGIDPLRALLREIVEERYVAGFSQFLPFNDARRLQKSDKDIAVDIPFNTPTASCFPQRFVVSDNELSANANAPTDPGICVAVEVNR